MWNRRWVWPVVLASACTAQRVEIVEAPDEDPADYELGTLIERMRDFEAAPESPDAFRRFATGLATLSVKFNEGVKAEAERKLLLAALRSLEPRAQLSHRQQFELLSTTVWPTALEVEPKANETPDAFARRACAGELATTCKHVLPEYWPTILNAKVWQRLQDRVRSAVTTCRGCVDRDRLRSALDVYTKVDRELSRQLGQLSGDAVPTTWPTAGPRAQPWDALPTFSLRADRSAHLDDHQLARPWHSSLSARRSGQRLGLMMRRDSAISLVRDVIADARRAGYREVALVVRAHQFPYDKRRYTFSLVRGKRAPIRDSDTVQILVQVLDAAANRGQLVRL